MILILDLSLNLFFPFFFYHSCSSRLSCCLPMGGVWRHGAERSCPVWDSVTGSPKPLFVWAAFQWLFSCSWVLPFFGCKLRLEMGLFQSVVLGIRPCLRACRGINTLLDSSPRALTWAAVLPCNFLRFSTAKATSAVLHCNATVCHHIFHMIQTLYVMYCIAWFKLQFLYLFFWRQIIYVVFLEWQLYLAKLIYSSTCYVTW